MVLPDRTINVCFDFIPEILMIPRRRNPSVLLALWRTQCVCNNFQLLQNKWTKNMLDTVKINHVQHISFTQSRLANAVGVILSELLSLRAPIRKAELFYIVLFSRGCTPAPAAGPPGTGPAPGSAGSPPGSCPC